MSINGVSFKQTTDIPAESLRLLFLKECWNDFMERDDVQFHLSHALEVISAWDGDELVGYARLEGDGRIWVEISDVLVKSEYQGRGIGTELVRRLVGRIKVYDPFYVQVSPVGDREVHLYAKFGFTDMPDYRRMELRSQKLDRKLDEVRGRSSDE